MTKILFSNVGYAKGIDGSLWQHLCYAGRHLYCRPNIQQKVLGQLSDIIATEDPDICCFVELDSGSFHSAYLNQLQPLLDTRYGLHDLADKYGENSWLGRMPLHRGKSNGFVAKSVEKFDKLYFTHGSKRLLYRILLADDVSLFFAHFSLQRKTRALQFAELKIWLEETNGPVIVMADFNILKGLAELDEFLQETGLVLLNSPDQPTFTFHTRKHVLDLCLCSPELAGGAKLRVIDQSFSDHDALLLEFGKVT